MHTHCFRHYEIHYRNNVWDLLSNSFTELDYAFALSKNLWICGHLPVMKTLRVLWR